MTIDERLDALTMNVELMALEQRDFRRAVRQSIDTLTELHADTERAMVRLGAHLIVHDERLNRLESKSK